MTDSYQEFQINVTCPLDGQVAVVARAQDGQYFCSHKTQETDCPSRCAARAVLNEPDRSERMVIVCPSDRSQAKVVVENGNLSWCSHQKDMPGCGMDCVRRAPDLSEPTA
jgi:hypothetical protein